MPAIPLPFVVTLFLVVLLARLILQGERSLRPAIWFIGACTITSVITGLRWSFDSEIVRRAQPFLAALLPAIAWLCFSTLKQPRDRIGPYLLAASVVLGVSLALGWYPGDLILWALFLGVGVALIRLAYEGPDGMGAARLSDVAKAQASALLAGVMLVGDSIVDLLIDMDFQFYRGSHAPGIIAVADLLFLPLVAYAVLVAGSSVTAESNESGAPAEDTSERARVPVAEDASVFAAFDALMRDKKLFRDPDLTLNRLARRLGVPSRQISGAVNRLHGRNVSQVVNEYRIAEAKRLLSETELSVTEIMLQSGFQTKSNFNREFLRVTGTSPSAWRRGPALQNSATETATAT